MTIRMTPEQRMDWIEAHMRTDSLLARGGVDVLNRDFVDAYIEATGVSYQATPYGAYRCRMLGLDLVQMVKHGVLRRDRVGIDGMAGMGFPRWVWSYRLTHRG